MKTNGTSLLLVAALAIVAAHMPPKARPRVLTFEGETVVYALNTPNYTAMVKAGDNLQAWLDENKGPNGEPLKSSALLPEFDRRTAELDTVTKAWEAENRVAKTAHELQNRKSGFNVAPINFGGTGPLDRGGAGAGSNGIKTVSDEFASLIEAHLKANGETTEDLLSGRSRFVLDLEATTSYAGIKATMTNAGTPGVPRFRPRIGRTEYLPLPTPMLIDMIPMIPTEDAAFEWLIQTAETNNAGMVSENAPLSDSDFTFVPSNVTLQRIGHILKVTREALADIPKMGALVETIGMQMLYRKLEGQLISGTGTTPQLLGVLNTPGIQSQAKDPAEPFMDTIYKAIQKSRTTAFAEPDSVTMHNDEWTPIRLSKTADGIYLFGPPNEAGPERLWGKPVIQNPVLPVNKAIVGPWGDFSGLFVKGGVEVDTATQNEDDFRNNRVAVRIQRRAALVLFRPSAFIQATK